MSSRKFPKHLRLNQKKHIQELYQKGSSFYYFPLKFTLLPAPEGVVNTKLLVSVSKRNFKKAVDRNRIKRLIRETFRLFQHELLVFPVLLAIHYAAKEIETYEQINKAMQKGILALKTKY
ncbi:MAG: ribonuclease P protein component [Cyclobacteriaceae bacterium]|jgi:ribonuclease P protein component|nr:ribonuclease P protein component [Cyclobacteriaceae bacterium]